MSDEAIMNPFMSIFGDVQAPTPVAAPTRDDAMKRASQEARKAGLLRRAQGTNRRDTILTTSQGDMTPATVQRVSVLGGTS